MILEDSGLLDNLTRSSQGRIQDSKTGVGQMKHTGRGIACERRRRETILGAGGLQDTLS